MNILGIGCHPDDLEIACYGTLAKYAKMGHNVAVCHVANGNLGHVEIMPQELRDMRWHEADEAAKVIGATHYAIDIPDLYVSSHNDALVEKLAKVVRDVQPDVIISHADNDYMNDHIETYWSAFRASFAASCPHFALSDPTPAAGLTPIYHMDTVAGTNFLPTEYVDISDVIELKLEALACHKSQLVWMLDHDGIDFLDFTRTCSKVRGYQCGAAYAEGFRPALSYLRQTTRRLLP